MGVRMKIELENLKGLKERADYLPKRELQWARWGENILAGWEERLGGRGRGEIYILREVGEKVIEGEKAGEQEEEQERR